MFNLQTALQPWNLKELTLADLKERLSEIRLKNLADMPPEIGVRELLVMALDRGWVLERHTGMFRVQVSLDLKSRVQYMRDQTEFRKNNTIDPGSVMYLSGKLMAFDQVLEAITEEARENANV